MGVLSYPHPFPHSSQWMLVKILQFQNPIHLFTCFHNFIVLYFNVFVFGNESQFINFQVWGKILQFQNPIHFFTYFHNFIVLYFNVFVFGNESQFINFQVWGIHDKWVCIRENKLKIKNKKNFNHWTESNIS